MNNQALPPWRKAAIGAMALILTTGLLTSVDAARGRHHDGDRGRGRPFGEFLRGMAGLDLSREQKEAIRDIIKDKRSSIRPLMERMREARMAMQDAITADPVDEALIRQKAQAMADAGVDLAVLRAQIGAKVRGVLTEEQRERVKELRERRKERGRARAAAARAYFEAMSEE
ncbi:Spy/CpxP family protein refolding chaperone [Candidatus Fermentibacteria bacterium]|nr:Spy/CpxP family protein refolding chaperone [Candidatus Fermentibacteria bacterium]